MKNDNALFYTCSLIEFIGRRQKQKRAYIVNTLVKSVVKRIYTHSDVLHCEVIDSVAEEFIMLVPGDFDHSVTGEKSQKVTRENDQKSHLTPLIIQFPEDCQKQFLPFL